MNGLGINGVTLFLCEIPTRKGLAFCFQQGSKFYPVAYVSAKHDAKAREYWLRMLGEQPATEGGE